MVKYIENLSYLDLLKRDSMVSGFKIVETSLAKQDYGKL